MIHSADIVVAEFGSLAELFTDHHLSGDGGENTVEVFPAALVAVIPWQTTPLVADCEFAEAEKVGIV